ncbi:AraC family transcriptional regulator [Photobacterium sanctipauli]|uniref:AraC family transcriptional regulator n=1 Tax=Photobacterium sanctipauli TaxID=1342794 RepID=A0A2T3NPK8_9GAMM|nr:helix-turn-helix domain-containing protein [Photobacterium sanctipauli]PSW18205.1 AraC family transcriptional regulator [Photobacterium sanctipauli]
MSDIIHLNSISETHRLLGLGKPKHPLVMVIPNNCVHADIEKASYRSDLYMISMKGGMSGCMKYGRSTYDFEDGVMIFLAPGQVIEPTDSMIEKDGQGWTLLFHPDLIRRSSLGQKINQYSFFSYDVNEALHISDTETQTLTELMHKVSRELEQSIDRHTENLICSNIELLLDYCTRFYDRQFYTRSNQNKDTIIEFDAFLRDYFKSDMVLEQGIPSVAYCGKALGVTPNYLSDLLKKETGKTAKEHIHLFIIELAKNKLLGSEATISQIAFDLGFDYPAHFTKLFKKSTGLSPSQFRKVS